MGEDHAEHHTEHHWETSIYPLILTAGIFFAVPLGFSAIFEYENGTLGAILLGLGVPLILIGVAGWVSEGVAEADKEPGYALTGLPLFIISETMIFLALFVSYWMLRLSADVWPPEGTPHIGITIPVIMTILLVSSSVTYHMGEERLDAGDNAGFRKWLLVTLALGVAFLGFTVFEYSHLIGEGFTFSTNAKSTAFYSITGFHASHVAIGLCMFLFVLFHAMKDNISHVFAKGAGLYWHFVDIIWFFVVSQIYFW